MRNGKITFEWILIIILTCGFVFTGALPAREKAEPITYPVIPLEKTIKNSLTPAAVKTNSGAISIEREGENDVYENQGDASVVTEEAPRAEYVDNSPGIQDEGPGEGDSEDPVRYSSDEGGYTDPLPDTEDGEDDSALYGEEGRSESGGGEPEPELERGEDFSGEYYDGGYSENSEDSGSGEEGLTYLGNWTISFYCPCEICCGQWATGCTASGTLAQPWHTAATDGLEFGTVLYVDGLGYFVVEDRGTEYGWLDVFTGDHQAALDLGLQYRDVYIVEG